MTFAKIGGKRESTPAQAIQHMYDMNVLQSYRTIECVANKLFRVYLWLTISIDDINITSHRRPVPTGG